MSESVKKKTTKPAAAAKPKATPAKEKPRAKSAAKATPGKEMPKSRTSAKATPAKEKPRAKTPAKSTPAKLTSTSKGAPKAAVGKHVARSAAGASGSRTRPRKSVKPVEANPVGSAANRRVRASRPKKPDGNTAPEQKKKTRKARKGNEPPKRERTLFGALNACLVIAIALFIALGARQQAKYNEFLKMREVVDQQTFYEGTTVEGVDVSKMTLANALDYWRSRVEDRYANRTATLDNGETVTARDLGYTSDYEAVLYAAWSAGRNGSLEQRYRMASSRRENPVAYGITRADYSDAVVDEYVKLVALQVDEPAVDANVTDFNAETYEFVFTEAQPGKKLDTDALKRDIEQVISTGGGDVALQIEEVQPEVSTEEVTGKYGLIDYAITNANSSSKARINNIKLAMSFINGTRVAPGETFSFNQVVGERTASRGFRKAPAFSGGDVTEQIGGGICQVSTTLFNAAVKADMEIVERHNHSLTVSYVDKGKDATVDWGHQDFRFTNTSEDDVFICCYLTNDNRVRFGIFGRLLPNGEKITLEGVTTEVTKYETVYEPSPLLAHGQTYLLQPGRNGYKAEAYKIRWDADGNKISKELLCKSEYKVKNEIIQYGA